MSSRRTTRPDSAPRPTKAEADLCVTERVTYSDDLHPGWVRATRILIMGAARLEAEEKQAREGARTEDLHEEWEPALGPDVKKAPVDSGGLQKPHWDGALCSQIVAENGASVKTPRPSD